MDTVRMFTDPRPLTRVDRSDARNGLVSIGVYSVLVISLLSPFASHATESVDPRAADFASRGFAETIALCRLPKTCAKKLPRNTRSEPATETGNDNIVEEHFVGFDGLEISFLFVPGNAAEPSPTDWKKGKPYPPPFVTNLKITSGSWPVRRDLRIGTSRAVVERGLGRLVLDDGGCTRITDEKTTSEVVLCFAKDRLRLLEWTPWWDG